MQRRARRAKRRAPARGRPTAARRRRWATLLALPTALAACGRVADAAEHDTGFEGVVLEQPLAKPDFTLDDTDGEPFDFRAETAGDLALLFFGYTSCPDICPVHMANLAAVLQRFDHATRSRIDVVFVTTDPARDTPDVLRAWLDRFDASFVGLTGTTEEIDAIQTGLGLRPAERPPSPTGDYAVGHTSQIVAFSPDGMAYVAYPAGVRQADWARDLPRLLEPDRYLRRPAP